jgi:hypothetical protein
VSRESVPIDEQLQDGDDLGGGLVFSGRGGFRVAVYRCACGREQQALCGWFPGGIGPKAAEGVGWARSGERWMCPFCSGNEEKLYAVFGAKPKN